MLHTENQTSTTTRNCTRLVLLTLLHKDTQPAASGSCLPPESISLIYNWIALFFTTQIKCTEFNRFCCTFWILFCFRPFSHFRFPFSQPRARISPPPNEAEGKMSWIPSFPRCTLVRFALENPKQEQTDSRHKFQLRPLSCFESRYGNPAYILALASQWRLRQRCRLLNFFLHIKIMTHT